MEDERERPVPAASAAGPALPSLKKDNCINNGRHRSVFLAQENIRLFIWKSGVQNIGLLTVTAADCLEVSEFQKKWHSFLNALKKYLPTGMWARERQPRSGNWHAHAVVNVGWDIQSDFPWDQVRKMFYANVDPRLRSLWKFLRENSESHGFGRIELLPLKHSGPACARYVTKYLGKALQSEKPAGSEKCRLFGVWGGTRFVHSRFTFLSSRIVQKRKQWLAIELELDDVVQLSGVLGKHWWFHFRKSLCEVIMPTDFYMVGPQQNRQWDKLGLDAFTRDCAAWPGLPLDNAVLHSQFSLFRDIGNYMFSGDSSQAIHFALNQIARPEEASIERKGLDLEQQMMIDLRGGYRRKTETCSP